jgi:CRP-like cAMP-binding protein
MATAVDDALAEVTAAIAAMADPLEGLLDYSRLNLEDDARREVQEAIADYDRRLARLLEFQTAADALLSDGYPDLKARDISESARENLAYQHRTITAALAQFNANTAVTMGLAPGAVETK